MYLWEWVASDVIKKKRDIHFKAAVPTPPKQDREKKSDQYRQSSKTSSGSATEDARIEVVGSSGVT